MADSTMGANANDAGASAGTRVIAEFEARAEGPLLSGDANVKVCADELVVSTLFDQLAVSYASVSFIAFEDYRVSVRSSCGLVTLTRMGRNAEWLHRKMWSAYNDAVLRTLGVTGECLLEAPGHFEADEWGHEFGGPCTVRLYADCVCLLPPNQNARRLPLCFLSGMTSGEYELELALSTGERYVVRRMGANLGNLERKLAERIRVLREDTATWHRELANDLPYEEAALAARLMPLGAALPPDARASVPTLAAALEGKARAGRMAATFSWLQEFAGGAGLSIGAKPAFATEGATDGVAVFPDAALGGLGLVETQVGGEGVDEAGGSTATEAQPEPIVWVAAPDAARRLAAVELALPGGEAAATYLYRIEGPWIAFARQIDRALEAAAFEREPFLLSEADLAKPTHAAEAMLVARTPAIGLLRSCFVGRAIHSSQKRWLGDIERALESL